MKDKKISKDDVLKLTKGLPTKSRTGSREVGHRLTKKERILFEAAIKSGKLKLPLKNVRQNLINVYLKWCEVSGSKPEIINNKMND